jgi:outer membrane receptor protein involved in Fe transport
MFFINGQFESRRYIDTRNISSLKPYFLLNAGINQKISNLLTFFVNFQNITNQSYESFYDYPMPGFNFTIGLKLGFKD